MKILIPFIILTALAFGHNALEHKHPELIPIPAYNAEISASAASANKAISAFLDSLTEAEKKDLVFVFDAEERFGWSNLPAGFVSRVGINVGSLSEDQRTLLFNFLSSSLSKEGYASVSEIMAAEGFLSHDERAARIQWAPENYWLSLYGEPGEGLTWGWQFGGHHLAINITITPDSIKSVSPTFLGIEPAEFSYKGEKYSLLPSMHKEGVDLFESLTDEQQAESSFETFPKGLAVGPGKHRYVPEMSGISVAELNEEQRKRVLALLNRWVGVQPVESAEVRMTEIEKELTSSYFSFIGEYGLNKKCYFRIQGPSFIAEFLSVSRSAGEEAVGKGHYHTVYRNLNLDYGGIKSKSEGE